VTIFLPSFIWNFVFVFTMPKVWVKLGSTSTQIRFDEEIVLRNGMKTVVENIDDLIDVLLDKYPVSLGGVDGPSITISNFQTSATYESECKLSEIVKETGSTAQTALIASVPEGIAPNPRTLSFTH